MEQTLYDNPWDYQGVPFTSDMIGDHFGFCYLIQNTIDGRLYIGKKLFTKAGYRMVKKKRKKVRLESDWKTYYSSSEELNEDVAKLGKETFVRKILRLCKSRSECSYYEGKYQFQYDVLLHNSYNRWISLKVRRSPQLRP